MLELLAIVAFSCIVGAWGWGLHKLAAPNKRALLQDLRADGTWELDGILVQPRQQGVHLTAAFGGAPAGLRVLEQVGTAERKDEISLGSARLDAMFRVHADDRDAAEALFADPDVRAVLPQLTIAAGEIRGPRIVIRNEAAHDLTERDRAVRIAKALEDAAATLWTSTGLELERRTGHWTLRRLRVTLEHVYGFDACRTHLRVRGAPDGLTLKRGESTLSNPILASQLAVEGTHPALEDPALTESLLVAIVEHGLELSEGEVLGHWEGFLHDPLSVIEAAEALVVALERGG